MTYRRSTTFPTIFPKGLKLPYITRSTEHYPPSMINTVDNINRNEVLLTDVNPGNFLFTPAHRPTRAVAIDFADARVRTFEDARYWEELIDMYWATPTVRKWMRRRFEKMGMSVPRLIQK